MQNCLSLCAPVISDNRIISFDSAFSVLVVHTNIHFVFHRPISNIVIVEPVSLVVSIIKIIFCHQNSCFILNNTVTCFPRTSLLHLKMLHKDCAFVYGDRVLRSQNVWLCQNTIHALGYTRLCIPIVIRMFWKINNVHLQKNVPLHYTKNVTAKNVISINQQLSSLF